MTAEVERVHGEVSSKVEIEDKCGLDVSSKVEIEDKCGLDVSKYQDLPNGTNQNGNAKEDSDDSYVFVSGNGNDAVSADSVGRDLNGDPAHDVPGTEEEEKEEEKGDNGAVGELKVENGGFDDCVVEENTGENGGFEDQNGTKADAVAEPDLQRADADGGVKVEVETREPAVVVTVADECECELPQAGNWKAESGQVNKLGSAEHVEETQGSQVSVGNFPDPKKELDTGEENGEGEIQSDPAVDIEENKESEIVLAEDVQDYIDRGKQSADFDQGKGSVELTNCGILLDGPSGDVGVDLEQNMQIDSSQVADVQLESEAVRVAFPNENVDVQLESEAIRIPVSDENGDGLSADHAEDSVSGTLFVNDLVDANQKTPEQNRSSENSESLPSPVQCDNVPVDSGESFATAWDNNTRVDLTNETYSQGPPKEFGLDLDKNSKMVPDVQLESEVSLEKEEYFPDGHDQESMRETTDINDADAGQSTVEEAKSLPSKVLCESIPFESGKSCPTAPINDAAAESDVETKASKITEHSAAGAADDVRTETEVVQTHVKCSETADSLPVDNKKVNIEVENGPTDNDAESSYPADCATSETETGIAGIKSEGRGSTFSSNDVKIESEAEVLEGVTEDASSEPVSVAETEAKPHASVLIETESMLSTCLGDDVRERSEVEYTSTLSSSDLPGNDAIVSEPEVLDGCAILSEENCVPDAVHVKSGVVESTGIDSDEKLKCLEVDDMDAPTSSCEGSSVDASGGQNVGAESEESDKRPFYFLVKVPRYDDENLRERIKHAESQVYQKTQSRDAIGAELQKIRVSCNNYGDSFNAAKAEERAARDLLKSKRQEIDSLQSKINRVKSAMSIEDIGGRVRNMEHMIQHETLPLKEEKQLIREIKQLNQLREQLSYSMGSQDEVQEALDQKDQIEERMKSLRKEADLLRDKFLKAEGVTTAAKKKYNVEYEKLNEVRAKFKAADYIRQEAYAHLLSLKKQLYEKKKYFRNYKDDATEANALALKKDTEALQRLCINQVESVMNLWNRNDEFREEYIRCNMRSTLKRLSTLDGRSLGPDEKPPVIPHAVNERVVTDRTVNERVEQDNTASLVSTLSGEKQEQVVPVKDAKVDDKPVEKAGEQKNQTTKSKKPVKSAPPASGSATVSGRDEIEEAKEEEHKRTKEEGELARKAEALRKEEELAKLKEQCRLDEKVKAKEALERKKRIADKAQAKAALRAQKEAEQKEREREKKLRKKEKRKSTAADDTSVTNEKESALNSETPTESPKEAETKEKSITVTKRPYKPSQFVKQTKAKSIPMPLRSRGKRRMQQWMWVPLTVLVVLALFLLGNSSFPVKSWLQGFGF